MLERFDDPSPVDPTSEHLTRAVVDGRRRVRRRLGGMAIGAVVVVVVVALGSSLFGSAEQDSSLQTVDGPSGWCDVLAEPFRVAPTGADAAPSRSAYDAILFLDPATSAGRFEQLHALLAADPDVSEVVPFDREAAYAEFVELFADTPGMVEDVVPESLPPSHRVVLVEGADAVAFTERYGQEAEVREVTLPGGLSGRVLDVLVGPVLVVGPAPVDVLTDPLVGGFGQIPRDDAQLQAFEDLAPTDVALAARTLAEWARGSADDRAVPSVEQVSAAYDAARVVATSFERHCGSQANAQAEHVAP